MLGCLEVTVYQEIMKLGKNESFLLPILYGQALNGEWGLHVLPVHHQSLPCNNKALQLQDVLLRVVFDDQPNVRGLQSEDLTKIWLLKHQTRKNGVHPEAKIVILGLKLHLLTKISLIWGPCRLNLLIFKVLLSEKNIFYALKKRQKVQHCLKIITLYSCGARLRWFSVHIQRIWASLM